MLDTSIQVKTNQFDGPLSLLLLLIQKEQMNIRELDLKLITKQYLEYLDYMQDLNFDVAGDYLYLAATLIYLKSKNCITEDDQNAMKELAGENDALDIFSHADLIKRLEELQRFQKLGEQLWNLPQRGRNVFVRPKLNKKYHLTTFLKKVELDELTLTMVDYLFREQRKYKVVKRDRLSIKEKLRYLKENLKIGDQTTLQAIIKGQEDGSITNLVINFISLLELARLKRIEIFQNDDRGEVYLNVKKSLDDFDIEQADGFDPEDEVKAKQEDKEVNEALASSQTYNTDSEDMAVPAIKMEQEPPTQTIQ